VKSDILVIGDICEDVYVYGNSYRLAPEAPVPIFISLKESKNLGMCGNVYANLSVLHADIDLICNSEEVIKKRYLDQKTNHLFLRVDIGDDGVNRINLELLEKIYFKKYKAIIISDYNKGFLTAEDIEYICERHNVVFLDTKKRIDKWANKCTFLKINEKEFLNSKDFLKDNEKLYKEKLIITLSERGCMYKDKFFPVKPVSIKDLSGAGDTFLAALAFKYVFSYDIEEAIIFANRCATQVVQKPGVSVINPMEL